MTPDEIWSPAAILADLDGTLVDSVASSERAWSAFARRRGLDEEETHSFAMGRPTRETVALLVPEPERDAEQAQIDRDEVDDADSVVAYPGAAELLAGPIPIAIVTSGSTALATARLRGAGLEPPAVLITADRSPAASPIRNRSCSAPGGSPSTRPAAWRSRTRRAGSPRRAPPVSPLSPFAPPTPTTNWRPRLSSSTPSPKPSPACTGEFALRHTSCG